MHLSVSSTRVKKFNTFSDTSLGRGLIIRGVPIQGGGTYLKNGLLEALGIMNISVLNGIKRV